jgi:NAD(P)-dependent dehydrogenase (short-subunit alcohol dehydrogenase family)
MGFLSGKAAVVLGASGEGSIGHKVATKLIAEGAKVMIAARREDKVLELAKLIGATAAVCDITSDASVAALAKKAVDAFGGLDIAINTAGEAIMGDIAVASEEKIRRAVDIHFIGPMFFFKHMAAAIDHDGCIITCSSITADRVIASHAAYMGAKAGTDHVARAAALEFGSRNIRVNSVSPGFTADTPMTNGFLEIEGLREAFEKEIPLGRLNTPDDVAHVCAWLCHDDSYITGQNIQVNGGNTLTRLPNAAELGALMTKER